MKTFTEEEISALAKSGKISQKDYLKLLFTAKQAVAPEPPKEEDGDAKERDILSGIRDNLRLIAGKIEPAKESLPTPPPQVTVNVPKHGTWTATVTKRDRYGYIETVSFKEVSA
jgi:hypothetical protein